MIRMLFALVFAGICFPGLAQNKLQEKPRERMTFFKPAVGDQFLVIDSLTGATNAIKLGEWGKSVDTRDRSVLTKSEVGGEVITLSPKLGPKLKLEIVEVAQDEFISKSPYVECRVTNGNKELGKVFLLTHSLNSRSVTLIEAPPAKDAVKPESAKQGPPNKEPPAKAVRTWASADGAFQVEAEFVSLAAGKVKLKRTDNGKEIIVEAEKLSDADRKWIDDRQK